ncbi:MAG: hypothetical protein RQ826_05590 [Xanthomonadales bacterium]|nr:hypothetical protein [Xanthomonadales bacterium]
MPDDRIMKLNLPVLDRNLFEIPATEIDQVLVLETLPEGETVFTAGTN